jgi:hypothetical protein
MVDWEGTLDGRPDEDLLDAVSPWLLASSTLVDAIQAAGLQGLRFGAAVTIDYVTGGRQKAGQSKEYQLVVPEAATRIGVKNRDLAKDGMSRADQLIYEDWAGNDFSYMPNWDGWLVTERALAVLRSHTITSVQVRAVEPA